jgi:glycosyltransferase involved in cell wall biosynthesis
MCRDGKLDELKKQRILKFDQYAEAIFALNPDLMYFLPKRAQFLPYTIAHWKEIRTMPFKIVNRKIKIVHSPTQREAKGSDRIIHTLHSLKQRYGDRIEVRIVENIPNQKALEVYGEADLAIDQILIGWYGGFAVEMMKMGKPVMAFIREEDLKFVPGEMAKECQQAIILVDPGNLYEKLCFLLENPEVLKGFREAALEYVHRWHDPVYVAGITKSVYES